MYNKTKSDKLTDNNLSINGSFDIILSMKNNYYIPLQSEEFAKNVFQIIKIGEPGSILFPPNMGKSNRLINNFIENNKSRFNNLHVARFDFTFYEIEDFAELFDILQREIKKAKRKKVVFFMTNVQTLIFDKNYNILNNMIDMQEKDQHIQFIFFFNIDITHPDIAKNIRTSLLSYIAYFPLYNREDTFGLISHQTKKWDMSIDDEQKEELAENCGGYFWLVKQALICLKDNPKLRIEDIFRYEGVVVALEQLYTSLLEGEREVLQDIIFGHKIQGQLEEHSLHYLEKIGLIKNHKITIPFLASYLKNRLPKTKIEIINNHIYVNSINVDNQFSKKEKKLFRVLIEKKSHLITRDELAKAIWPINTENYYSDWAVDRLVARLRTRINALGIKELIKTVRNQGYMLTE